MNRLFRRNTWLAVPLTIAFLPSTAFGEVINLDAVLEARTQQFVNGEPVSSDEVFEDFGLTSTTLPIQVISYLEEPTPTNELIAAGQGIADVDDPDLSAGENPEELGLEADAFSIDAEIAYQVTASAVEERTIRFTTGELSAAPGEEREVESSVFLSGAIIVWSLDPARDLTGLSAEVTFTVDQFRPDDSDGVTVFRSSMGVRGSPDGEAEPFSEGEVFRAGEWVSEGIATFEFGGPETILNPDEPNPLLEEYLAALGRTHVMLIPDQKIDYIYSAEVGEEFDLVATFEVDLTNLPDGTGVSAVFGRGFQALSDMIDEAFADVDGQAVEAGVNLAQARSVAPQSVQAGTDEAATGVDGGRRGASSGSLCGSLGFEAVGMLLLVAVAPLTARWRRA